MLFHFLSVDLIQSKYLKVDFKIQRKDLNLPLPYYTFMIFKEISFIILKVIWISILMQKHLSVVQGHKVTCGRSGRLVIVGIVFKAGRLVELFSGWQEDG